MSDQPNPGAPQEIGGLLVRGADGNLYFIPNDRLQAFRVPDAGRDLMAEKLIQAPTAVGTSIPSHWTTLQQPLCFIGCPSPHPEEGD